MKKMFIISIVYMAVNLCVVGQISNSNATIVAQDKITFTWQVQNGGSFSILATMGEPFTVNWGDGNIETFVCDNDVYTIGLYHGYETDGEYFVTIEATNNNCRITEFDSESCMLSLDITGSPALTLLTCNYGLLTDLCLSGCTALTHLDLMRNRLTDLDLSDCTNLLVLSCWDNELTNLDLSNCTNLIYLSCSNNKLTNINLLGCMALETIYCSENQLQLSDLFEIQLKGINNIFFGTQNLLPQTAIIEAELFSEQSVFDEIFTDYSITKDEVHASESDYTVVDGKLTFNELGAYVVTMTNIAIGSFAKVIAPIEILPVNIKENAVSNINVYPNPTTGELIFESKELSVEKIEVLDITGKIVLTNHLITPSSHQILDISNLNSGIYFVKVFIEQGEIVRKVIKQ